MEEEKKDVLMDISTYPEGYEMVKKELLPFLPDDDAVREAYMRSIIGFMVRA